MCLGWEGVILGLLLWGIWFCWYCLLAWFRLFRLLWFWVAWVVGGRFGFGVGVLCVLCGYLDVVAVDFGLFDSVLRGLLVVVLMLTWVSVLGWVGRGIVLELGLCLGLL